MTLTDLQYLFVKRV